MTEHEILFIVTLCTPLIAAASFIVAAATFWRLRRQSEMASVLDFIKRYDDHAAAMASAVSETEQFRTTGAMLNFLETIAYLHNHRRAGVIVRNNIRALTVDFVAGIGGIQYFDALIGLFGPGPDTYSDLRQFARRHRVLISRQQAKLAGTIADPGFAASISQPSMAS